MRKSNLSSIIFAFGLATVLVGCSGSQGNTTGGKDDGPKNVAGKNEYPQSVADEFVKACEGAGNNREFCTCIFAKVQQRYTFEEFSVIESKIAAGRPPDDFIEFRGKARAECTK